MAEWVKLTSVKFHDRKWELKQGDVVLGTIFQKPAAFGNPEKFSVYFSTPRIYARYSETSKTFQYDTFEEATQAFKDKFKENVEHWAEAVMEYFAEENNA